MSRTDKFTFGIFWVTMIDLSGYYLLGLC